MNKPDDIPQDVWDAAHEFYDKFSGMFDTFFSDQYVSEQVGRLIMAARLQEREQCAKVAEDRVWNDADLKNSSSYEYGGSDVAGQIAQAIRNRK